MKLTDAKRAFERTFFPLSWKNMARFAGLWLSIGFAIGTSLLLGPIRKITFLLRSAGWSESSESLVVIAIIVVYVAATFLATAVFLRISIRSEHKHVSKGISIIWIFLALCSLYLWLNPSLLGSNERLIISNNPRFTFGSYPSAEDIQQLEQEGYTAIISLLHPAVIPFEPELIRRERNAVEENGITFIHLPMLPWISDNSAALDSLKNIAETGSGKYYVHCYLGQDRIGTARRIIESVDAPLSVTNPDSLSEDRNLTNVKSLERGAVTVLEEGVFVTPYPTDDEFVKYIFGNQFTVFSLMNPNNERDLPWINKEKEILGNYDIPFFNHPLSLTGYDAHAVLEAARKVKSVSPPVLVHGFRAPGFRSQAFIQAYRSDLPPLSIDLLPDSLSAGALHLISPNVISGPRPDGPEFGSVLERNGINEFIFLGPPNDSAAVKDSVINRNANIPWRSFPLLQNDIRQLLNILQGGGPWYVYGPKLEEVMDTLSVSLGPAFPDSVLKTTISTAEKNSNNYIDGFISQWIPPLKLSIILTPFLLIYVMFSAIISGYLKTSKNIPTAYTRKVFHVFIFVMAGMLQVLINLSAVVLFGVLTSLAVLYATYRGKGFPFYESMARPKDKPRQTLFILVPLATTAAGGIISNLLFGTIAYIGYLVTGLGDAVGEPVGKRYGKHTYKVPSLAGVSAERSLEGSAAVLLISIIVSFMAFLAVGYSFFTALWVAVSCGVAASLVEAVSNHGLDNLTIQIAATAVAYFLLF